MGFEIVKESYAGSIKPITIGKGDKAITVGGANSYPFYQFEGDMPNKPKIAMEIWDMEPTEWPEAAKSHFSDVFSDPAAWAKKCVDEFGAEAIVLQLKSTDPNDKDASPEDVVKTVKKVLKAIDVPLILWGMANGQKDEDVLKKISESCEGEKLLLGPVEEINHKGIGASAMGYGHMVISSSPIDVNLAKQVNILLENLGVPMDRIVVDPTTGGLGYGLEYSYSVMERLGMAALAQGDDKLQLPMINNLANEIWRCKEAGQSAEDAPELGDPERRVIMMEVVGAVSYLLAGSNILIMRHPEAIRLVKSFIDLLADGGSAQDVKAIVKQLDDVDIDYAKIAPKPDLTIEAAPEKKAPAKKAAPEKKAAAPKKAAAKPAAKAAPKAAVKEEKVEAPEMDPEAEAKAAAAAEAKANADAEAKAAAATEAKVKAAAEAEAKAEADTAAKAKAEAEAKSAEAAKREAEEEAIRQQRAKEQEERMAKAGGATKEEKVANTASKTQRSALSKFKKIRR